MDTWTTLAVLLAGLLVGGAAGAALGWFGARSRPSAAAGLVDQAEVMQGLDRLSDQLIEIDRERASWQGEFRHHLSELQQETRGLTTALRRPQVRGRWGELHLRRAVELAGLVDRCDFTEQLRVAGGSLRPDLVVHLVGGRQVVVDAKVPLDAYLDATTTDDRVRRDDALARHARQLRQHVDALSSKAYWRALPETPEFVVLFVPAESCLAVALETDRDLIEYAAERQVVLASPTTLIALLRTVAHGWRHEALADQAREIHRLGRDLHDRLGDPVGPPRRCRSFAHGRCGPLQQRGRQPGVPGAGLSAPVPRPRGHRRRPGVAAAGRGRGAVARRAAPRRRRRPPTVDPCPIGRSRLAGPCGNRATSPVGRWSRSASPSR